MNAVQQETFVLLLRLLRGFINLTVKILDSFQNLQQWVSSINIANFWELSKEHKLLNLIAMLIGHSALILGIFSVSI